MLVWKVKNIWKLAREVSDRIQEPGPRKHDFLNSVPCYPKERQILQFLAKYLIPWKKAPAGKRIGMRGNALFLKLQKLNEDRVRKLVSCSQVPDLSDSRASSPGYIASISDQIDRLLPSVQVKRLFVSGKLTSSNSNEPQKVCEEFIVDESACKSLVQHQEFPLRKELLASNFTRFRGKRMLT